jgi:hypothetical protein
LTVPAALRLWHGLALGAQAPLSTEVLANMFGLSSEEILPLLKALARPRGDGSRAGLAGSGSPGTGLDNLRTPLLADWGRDGLSAYAQTLAAGALFDEQEVQQRWQTWWRQFLGECSVRGAEPLYRRVISSRERTHGKWHADTCQAALSLALLLTEMDRPVEALQFAGQAYEGLRANSGVEHEDTQRALRLLQELGSEQKESKIGDQSFTSPACHCRFEKLIPVGFGDATTGHLPGVKVQSSEQIRIAFEGAGDAVIGDLFDEAVSRVGQRLRRGAGVGRGHVGDAVDATRLPRNKPAHDVSSDARSRRSRLDRSRYQRAHCRASSPWSMARVMSFGAFAPGTSTAPTSKSTRGSSSSKVRRARVKRVRRVHRDVEKTHPLDIDFEES